MGSLKVMLPASAILLLAAMPAASAQTETKTYALKDALQVCARVASPTDRLACFDDLAQTAAPEASGKPAKGGGETAALAPATAPASKAAPTDAPSDKVKTDESRYVVMRAEDYEKENRKAAAPEKAARAPYEAVVLRAWKYGNGEYHIALTNGEIWKSQASENPRPVKDGEKVELQPGAIGSWFMEFKTLKRPMIKVTRLE